MLTIRPFTYSQADYAAISTILSRVWPDRDSTVATLQHIDNTCSPQFFSVRFVAEVDRSVVAVAEGGESAIFYRPGKYSITLDVDPAWEQQGIGSALYAHLLTSLSTSALSVTMLVSTTREDKPQAIRFLERRGYTQVMRSPLAALDVHRFQFDRFTSIIPKVEQSGIQLLSLAHLRTLDSDWQRKVYDLDWECTLDEPLPDAPTKLDFAQYVGQVFGHPNFLPEAWFIALDEGRYVGMTATNRNARHPQQLDTVFTAVVRSHRRRGLATALKLLAIDYARRNGFQTIKTDNEEHNPMFKLNLALGFHPEPALLFYQKTF